MPALTNWLYTRHNWRVEADHILRAPNILNALAIAASLFTGEGDNIIVQPPVFFDFYDIFFERYSECRVNRITRNEFIETEQIARCEAFVSRLAEQFSQR